MQKTILISSFHPFISRNILSTRVLQHILESRSDVRIVILVPDYKKEYFEKNFLQDRVSIKGVKLSGASKWRTLFFKRLARTMLDTQTARIQKRSKLYIEGGIIYFLASYGAVGIGKFKLFRKTIRFLDYWFADFERFNDVLFHCKPDLIVATDVQNEYNVSLLQAASYYRIPSVAMVRSWDNLTSMQGIMRITPDVLLVPTQSLKKEAGAYHDVPTDNVRVVGIPHYDRYKKEEKESRENFFHSMKLDPKKKLILYTTLGDRYKGTASVDQTVLETLKNLDVNVMVRCHPGDTITLDSSFAISANIVFDRPGVVFNEKNFGDREISREDDTLLMHELYYSDCVVFCASTIAVDAALFDKPLVGVAFSEVQSVYWASPRRFYDYTHLRQAVKSGGIRMVESKEALVQDIKEYFQNPSKDHAGRKKIVETQGGFPDEESSLRVAKNILIQL